MAFLTAKELKLYLIGLGFVTLLALFITVLVMLLGGNGNGRGGSIAETPSGEGSAYTMEGERGRIFDLEEQVVSQMEVPEEYSSLFEAAWKPFRGVHERWSREQIDRYWIDPKQIVEEQLKKESDEAVRSFLEELP